MDSNADPIIVIKGKQIALGPLRHDLLALYTKWFNDLEVMVTWGLRRSPATMPDVEAWYEKTRCDDRTVAFNIYEAPSARPLGYVMLTNLNFFNQIADLDIVIGEKECWGRGYGTEAVTLMLDYGFTILNLHNIMLTVRSYNERGIRAYKRAGFREIGHRREARRFGGKAYDVIYMDCIATDFKSAVLCKFLPNTERL